MTHTDIPVYTRMPRPEGATDRLVTFLTDRLNPQIDRIREQQMSARHKLDFLAIGQEANSLRMEAARWLAEAERLMSVAYADQMENVHDSEPERLAEGGNKRGAEALKARARERVSTIQKAVDVLKYARDDLSSTLMFVQTALRTVRDEEFQALAEDSVGVPNAPTERAG